MLVDQIERRSDPRIRTEIELEVSYRVPGDDSAIPDLQGWLTEISDNGARLRLDRPQPPNTDLIVSGLPERDDEAVVCSVRWIRKAPADGGSGSLMYVDAGSQSKS